MTTDHPAVEAVARYLAREYWGNQESEGDHTAEAREIVQIVEAARRPYTPWSEVKARRVGRIARVWAAGDWEPEDRPRVRDQESWIWTRYSDGWYSAYMSGPLAWDDVLQRGPVTEVWDD